jgi:hypothetical protein
MQKRPTWKHGAPAYHLSSGAGGMRLSPQAARTAGPPKTRPRRCINRAKRTLRRGPLHSPRGGMTSTDGSTIESRGTHPVCVGLM